MSNEATILSSTSNATAAQGNQAANEAARVATQAKPEAVPAERKAPPSVDAKLVAQAIEVLNEMAESQQRNLKFSVDEPSGRTIIRVYDSSSDELIRQIPGETVLQIAERFGKGDMGALMDVVA